MNVHAFDGFSIDKTPAEGLDGVFANAPTPDMYVMEIVPTPLSDEELEGLVEKPLSAVKYDGGKIRLDLIPFDALDEIARALEYGAIKYSEGQWEGGFEWRRLIGATLRHVTSWARGQDKDPESGVSHLAHAGAMILFLLSHELRGIGKDNRFKY